MQTNQAQKSFARASGFYFQQAANIAPLGLKSKERNFKTCASG